MNNFLTVAQVSKACAENKYLLLRYNSGCLIGVNGIMAKIARRKIPLKDTDKTGVIGFIPCSFDEYLTHKTPFIIPLKKQTLC